VVELGPASEVYERPTHHYTVGLLDAVPEAEVEVARSKARRQATVQGELPSSIDPPSGCRFRTRCPAAQEVCAQREPPLTDFGNGHFAACHFPVRTPVSFSRAESTSD
jgi:oligopeptide/dipeptide ABC transporter ATP-binding protein